MSLTKSLKPNSDHRHEYAKPLARLANPERGLFFLLWQCSCGKERASDLLSREGIESIKEQYRKRVGGEKAEQMEKGSE